jgi:hypothetical protein
MKVLATDSHAVKVKADVLKLFLHDFVQPYPQNEILDSDAL